MINDHKVSDINWILWHYVSSPNIRPFHPFSWKALIFSSKTYVYVRVGYIGMVRYVNVHICSSSALHQWKIREREPAQPCPAHEFNQNQTNTKHFLILQYKYNTQTQYLRGHFILIISFEETVKKPRVGNSLSFPEAELVSWWVVVSCLCFVCKCVTCYVLNEISLP